MRFASKDDVVSAIETEHATLVELLASIPRTRYAEPGVWGDGWTVKDLLAHLTAWEQMFLRWYREGRAGREPALPAPGFRWNQTPELNRAIWRKHRRTSVKRILEAFETSYDEILTVAHDLPQEALLEPRHYPWTGRYPLTTYLAPNTSSHYRTATKILKRWLKGETRHG